MLEDKLLIVKLKHGNRDALRRLYEKYKDYLLRIAVNLSHDRGQAEDVVQDVFVRLVQSGRNYNISGNLKAYLTKSVVNGIRSNFRKKSAGPIIGLDEIAPPISNAKQPDEWIIHHERSEQIHNAMAKLPYEQIEAIVLRIQANMKFKEIAAIQKVSTKTAISRYQYGIDKLRSLLNGEVTK